MHNVSCVTDDCDNVSNDCGYKLSADKTRCIGNCEEGINYQFFFNLF